MKRANGTISSIWQSHGEPVNGDFGARFTVIAESCCFLCALSPWKSRIGWWNFIVHDVGIISRKTDIRLVQVALKRSRVVALLGPRQCGKTTLARQFMPADSVNCMLARPATRRPEKSRSCRWRNWWKRRDIRLQAGVALRNSSHPPIAQDELLK